MEISDKIEYNEDISDEIIQISTASPLGKECLSKENGDVFSVLLPDNKKARYKILEIQK